MCGPKKTKKKKNLEGPLFVPDNCLGARIPVVKNQVYSMMGLTYMYIYVCIYIHIYVCFYLYIIINIYYFIYVCYISICDIPVTKMDTNKISH